MSHELIRHNGPGANHVTSCLMVSVAAASFVSARSCSYSYRSVVTAIATSEARLYLQLAKQHRKFAIYPHVKTTTRENNLLVVERRKLSTTIEGRLSYLNLTSRYFSASQPNSITIMKGFLEGFLFRPQGKPQVFPVTLGAKLSQFPYRTYWHEAWVIRYLMYAVCFVTLPLYWQIDKSLTSPQNKALWREKRKHELEHLKKDMEKIWEVRT